MSGGRPPRLLCCWGYAREGWVAPFERLAGDGRFHVEYLFYRRPSDEPTAIATGRPRHFWESFRSGHDVIERTWPDAIVFMEVDSAWAVGLNLAARRSGVPTVLLTHGLKAPQRFVVTPPGPQGLGRLAVDPVRRLTPLRFVRRSGASRRTITDVVRMTGSFRSGHPFEARRVDRYLLHGAAAVEAITETHGDVSERTILVGLPEHDALFRPLPDAAGGAVLFIDTPATGGPHMARTVDPSAKQATFVRLAAQLRADGRRLVVKLHPDSYADDWAVDAPGLTYLREADVAEAIAGSDLVIGSDSTLLIPAAHHRPLLLVDQAAPSYITERADRLGASAVVPALTELSATDIATARSEADRRAPARAAFVREFTDATDGRSLARVADELDALVPADRVQREASR